MVKSTSNVQLDVTVTDLEVYDPGPPVKRFKANSEVISATDLLLQPESSDDEVLTIKNQAGTTQFSIDTSTEQVTSAFPVTITDTTPTTSTTTGALVVSGAVASNGGMFTTTLNGTNIRPAGTSTTTANVLTMAGDSANHYSRYFRTRTSGTDKAGVIFSAADSANYWMYADSNGLNIDFTDNTNAPIWPLLSTASQNIFRIANTFSSSQLKHIIDVSDTAALLVRKNGNSGDILTVDTTNSVVRCPATTASTSSTTGCLVVSGGTGIAGNLNCGAAISGSLVQVGNGSVSAPSLSFTSSTNTGLYYDASKLHSTVNGTNCLTLDTSALQLSVPLTLSSASSTLTTTLALSGSPSVILSVTFIRINNMVTMTWQQVSFTGPATLNGVGSPIPVGWDPVSGTVSAPVLFAQGGQNLVRCFVFDYLGGTILFDPVTQSSASGTGACTIFGGSCSYLVA